MLPMTVSLQAELLITRMLTVAEDGAARAPKAVSRIELFRHALYPHNVLFGTAWVDGQFIALAEPILVALRAQMPAPVAAAVPTTRPVTFRRTAALLHRRRAL